MRQISRGCRVKARTGVNSHSKWEPCDRVRPREKMGEGLKDIYLEGRFGTWVVHCLGNFHWQNWEIPRQTGMSGHPMTGTKW